MTEDEGRELAELRSKLEAIERSVAALDTRLQAVEGSKAVEGAGAREKAGAAASAAPPHTRPARRTPGRTGAPLRPNAVDVALQRVRRLASEGNPLNKLGALSLIVGAGIVFKYAVDSGWIGPTGRVVLGLAVGAALLAAGEVYARRSWHRFASGLVAAGGGVVFVAVWFGQQQYGVVPAGVAFLLYVTVTAFVVAQSLRYDSRALAVGGLLGGYLAPALASTGSGNWVLLSSYLLVLNAGVFAIASRRSWRPLEWQAFAFTVAYTAAWVFAFRAHPGETRWLELHWLLPFLAAFFLSFAAIPTWRSLRRREPIGVFARVLTVANGVVHFGFAVALLRDAHRAWLGLVAAAVAALYALVSARIARESSGDLRALRVFAGTAAGFLLLATPYLASGPWITLVWCAETALLAWGCTRSRFGFLRLHVVAMLAIVAIRLIGYDGLLESPATAGTGRYLPFLELRSWPPFAATLTFAWVARMLGRAPTGQRPLVPGAWLWAAAGVLLVAAVDAETGRIARFGLAPLASSALQDLIRAGLLVVVVCGLWLAVRSALPPRIAWAASAAMAAALAVWTLAALVWLGGYGSALHILGDGHGLWWLHLGVLSMTPLLLLVAWLARELPEWQAGPSRQHLQSVLYGVALVLAMLLLRREAFALTHAPPFADWIPDAARRAGYRSILSVSYALLAFGVYVRAVRRGHRVGLHAAYALYGFTALKVYLFDLESQNQLYRASSLIIFAAVLFVSSHYASRYANRPAVEPGGAEHV